MKYIDLTLGSAAENLACDEALLAWCETEFDHEVIRFWRPSLYFVVLGFSNQISGEIDLNACQRDQVPVLRRCSGGGTVLQGPGCLNYTLILRMGEGGPLQSITASNRFIMTRHRDALTPWVQAPLHVQGHTDLTLNQLKFSGNAQKRHRRYLMFHGTFLTHFEIERIEQYLRMPTKQPPYRKDRRHSDFLTNLPLAEETIRSILRNAWQAEERLEQFPAANSIQSLVETKYSRDEWNFKF